MRGVNEREFFERWDRRLERSDELLAEIRVEVALTRDEVRLSREQRERSDAMHADLRDFIRQMIARMERSGRDTSEALRAQTAELRRFGAEMSDIREESRAQTNAILRLLDRFGGPEAGGAAGTA